VFANSGFGIDARHKGIMNGENYEPWWALPNFEIHDYEELQRSQVKRVPIEGLKFILSGLVKVPYWIFVTFETFEAPSCSLQPQLAMSDLHDNCKCDDHRAAVGMGTLPSPCLLRFPTPCEHLGTSEWGVAPSNSEHNDNNLIIWSSSKKSKDSNSITDIFRMFPGSAC
jgi:hypothetical protein